MRFVKQALGLATEEVSTGRYWLNSEHVVWPLREIYLDDRPAPERLVAVSGPCRTNEERQAVNSFVRAGYGLLGVSSYQNFPQPLCNPHEYGQATRFSFFDEYAGECRGWLHCFRDPSAYLPRGLPRVLLPESDFTDFQRIRPDSVDHVAIDGEKRYDFGYVCDPGPWNEFCRNWPLAKTCLSSLSDRGASFAVFGRDRLDELQGAPGLHVFPHLPWHEFMRVLARCRFLFVPNVYDASPRIMAEALCLDIPLLVNRRILGGWHYVERPSGVFFSDESDFGQAVDKLLKRRFRAREYFVRLFGHDYAGTRLGRFLAKLRRRL